jgi:hypothetical protein
MRTLLIAYLFVLPIGLCNAQSAPVKPIEPASIGIVYRIDPSSQELKPLPDEQWKETGRLVWPVAAYQSVVVAHPQSTFRIKAGETIEFTFKTGSPEKVSLYRFERKGKKREFDYYREGSTSGNKVLKGLPVDVTTYGERSYKLTPGTALTPGEYAITIAGTIYSFGVD